MEEANKKPLWKNFINVKKAYQDNHSRSLSLPWEILFRLTTNQLQVHSYQDCKSWLQTYCNYFCHVEDLTLSSLCNYKSNVSSNPFCFKTWNGLYYFEIPGNALRYYCSCSQSVGCKKYSILKQPNLSRLATSRARVSCREIDEFHF